MSKVDSVIFRMYNTGSVGDCLLLRFQKNKITTFSMLIDCGAWSAHEAEISKCVEDIKTTCNGKIDLLVITHEHKDHLSGFNQARSIFDKIKFEQIWMSWVENGNDPVAGILKEHYTKKLKELKKSAENSLKRIQKASKNRNIKGAAKRLENSEKNLDQALEAIDFELGMSTHKGVTKNAGKTIADAMNYLKSRKKPDYKNPGEVISNLKGAEGIKFYVLGPPKDEEQVLLKKDSIKDEMYHLALSSDTLKFSAARKIFTTGIHLADNASPFHEKYFMAGKEKAEFDRAYNSPELKWRQIEDDLDGTEMALTKLVNTMVNNTSLALAIEFEDSGNVILLPADAQSGNWMSWHSPQVSKKLKTKGGKSTEELLQNTVFYKVGHHGSHNGTASVHGLDMMNHPKLVAFMPLVQDAVPVQWGGAENFPDEKLYQALIEKTKGRLVRTDEGLVTHAKAVKLRKALSAADAKELKADFKKDGIYCEYVIRQ
ncbi:hypothetical protein BH11BAC7_BH11BAC7_04610 [soil metagenome]